MSTIELVYNRANKQFEIDTLVSINGSSYTPEKMVVDTGSAYTSLSEEIVTNSGIDCNDLPLTDVYGISGPAKSGMVKNVKITVDTNTVKTILFDEIRVNFVQEKKQKPVKVIGLIMKKNIISHSIYP